MSKEQINPMAETLRIQAEIKARQNLKGKIDKAPEEVTKNVSLQHKARFSQN